MAHRVYSACRMPHSTMLHQFPWASMTHSWKTSSYAQRALLSTLETTRTLHKVSRGLPRRFASVADPQLPPNPPPAPPRRGFIAKAVGAVREYGASAVVIYTTLWIGPGIGSYYALLNFDNFGFDAGIALQYLPVTAKTTILEAIGVAPDGGLEPWHTSVILAYLFTDVLELVRFPATLWLAPKLKRWIVARRG